MKKFAVVVLAVGLALAILAGCAPEIPLQEGMVISGGDLTITLEENATTGYTWLYSIENEDVLKFKSEETLQDKQEEGLAGAPGFHRFVFSAVGDGTSRIQLDYVRPWEMELPSEETIVVTVTVEGGNIKEAK